MLLIIEFHLPQTLATVGGGSSSRSKSVSFGSSNATDRYILQPLHKETLMLKIRFHISVLKLVRYEAIFIP